MNYRHAYHAGNFADVLKHLILTLIIEHLKLKPAPFRVIDTHAGLGRYDLTSIEAGKTGEYASGIGRLINARLTADATKIIAPYLDAVKAFNIGSVLTTYPGSPALVRQLLRRDDRLIVNELHDEDHAILKQTFDCDPQTKVMQIDGWNAVKALLPPKERRGAVLIDPPFEQPGDYDRLVLALGDSAARFATGTAVLWYPIKDDREVRSFERQIAGLGLSKILVVDMMVRDFGIADGLPGTGLIVLNPPFTLESNLRAVLPQLTKALAQGAGATFSVRWLAGEKPTSLTNEQ
jgi:23S rRNA (adenine2030-N6)-methyltransferase